MNFKELIFYEDLNKEYEKLYSVQRTPIVKREWDSVKIILDELSWEALSDSEKQESRIGALSLGKKWSEANGDNNDLSMNQLIIDLYNLLDSALASAENPSFKDVNIILRIRAIFSIEKKFINEYLNPSKLRHNDYYVMNSLLNEFKDRSPDLCEKFSIEQIQVTFNSIYKRWDKRPYREID